MHLEQVNLFMILAERRLNVSFSKVKYHEMAPKVGLFPFRGCDDMGTFVIHRARIRTSLSKEIVQDIEVALRQYGEPFQQLNEEARSRYLAPVSAHLLLIFCTHARTILLVALSGFLI
jgi:hypothetical protein